MATVILSTAIIPATANKSHDVLIKSQRQRQSHWSKESNSKFLSISPTLNLNVTAAGNLGGSSWLRRRRHCDWERMATARPGGTTKVDGATNNIEIVRLAKFAVEEYNKKEKAKLVFIKVLEATQQVVEGFLYCITLVTKHGNEERVYVATVLERAWENVRKLEKFEASPSIGGITSVQANSIEIEDAGKFAVEEHNKEKHAKLVFVRVVDAQQQVVDGFLYYLTLKAKDGEGERVYDAKVLDEVGKKKKLEEFTARLLADVPASYGERR